MCEEAASLGHKAVGQWKKDALSHLIYLQEEFPFKNSTYYNKIIIFIATKHKQNFKINTCPAKDRTFQLKLLLIVHGYLACL